MEEGFISRAREAFAGLDVDPVRGVRQLAALATQGLAGMERAPGDDPSARNPAFVGLMMDAWRVLATRYFRWQVQGVSNVPAQGPALLVGNHCGGIVTTEAYLTFLAIWDHLGPDRVLSSLAHDILFADPMIGDLAGRFGALRAGHGSGERALEAGNLLLVYPGSDLDSFRSFADRKRVVLGKREGFVKLALRTGAPVVPVVAAGAHEQWIVLTRGDGLAKLLGMKRWLRTDACPIALSFPWGITSGYLPYLPMPAQVTLAFGEPIAWPELGPDAADDPVVVARCREEVRAAMQGMLDRLYEKRWPFVGEVG